MLCHAGTILLVASQFMSYYNVAHETWHGQIGPPKTFPLHNSTQHLSNLACKKTQLSCKISRQLQKLGIN